MAPANDDESTAPLVFDDGKRALLPEQAAGIAKGAWSPKRADAERASDGIPALLATKGAPGARIAAKLGSYHAQIWGTTDAKGTKVIHLNFLCTIDLGGKPDGWTRQAIEVDDGGECFFQADFDPVTSSYTSFTINGQA